jgi:hypothetical protein
MVLMELGMLSKTKPSRSIATIFTTTKYMSIGEGTPVKKVVKIILFSLFGVIVALILWWSHFMFWLPHFHEDEKGNLVSGDTKLVLVSKMLPDDKSGITIPNSLPFWDSIGIVDGDMDGRLWKFTDKGEQYVLYIPNTEMPWHWVYRYSTRQ